MAMIPSTLPPGEDVAARNYAVRWRRLQPTDLAELETYCDRGEELWGARYAPEYLARGAVHAAFEPDGTMVGGFAFVPGPGLRTLAVLPEPSRRDSELLRRVGESGFNEVAGIWFRPVDPANVAHSAVLWERFRQALGEVAEPYVIFGYNFERSTLAALYSLCEATILYRGPARSANALPGNHHATISVEAATPARMAEVVSRLIRFQQQARG